MRPTGTWSLTSPVVTRNATSSPSSLTIRCSLKPKNQPSDDLPLVAYPSHTLWRAIRRRSYWIPGSYDLALPEKRNSFVKLLKKKGFKEESMTKVGLYAISTSTTLESNKSQGCL